MNNYCNVSFSRGGGFVRLEVRKGDRKGPKVGRLFPLQFYIPRVISLSSNTVSNQREVRHKRIRPSQFFNFTIFV